MKNRARERDSMTHLATKTRRDRERHSSSWEIKGRVYIIRPGT